MNQLPDSKWKYTPNHGSTYTFLGISDMTHPSAFTGAAGLPDTYRAGKAPSC